MNSFLALLAFLQAAAVPVTHVRIPTPDGTLDAALVRPVSDSTALGQGIAVVALHGCGGPFPSRDGSWAVTLARQGFTVLLPDSFGSRGLGSQCRVRNRQVRPAGKRRQDAIAAAEWLREQTATPQDAPSAGIPPVSIGSRPPTNLAPQGIALLGWSNGGGTVLATARAPDLPPGLFQRFVAFYPGCTTAKERDWNPAAALMLLVGASDDWTPAAPCQAFAARHPDLVTLVVYPGAYHDFDALDRPVQVLHGLATPPSGSGQAHAGTDPAARADALQRVPVFLAGH